jgi:hypothetical protein
MYFRAMFLAFSVWAFTPPASAQSAESLLALWATQTGQSLTKGLSKQVTGLARDIAQIPRAAIPIVRLPIGLFKTTIGAILPGQSANAGKRDINAGIMAPIKTLERIIDIPVNVLERF